MLRMIVLAVLAFGCNSDKANKAREALDKVDKVLDDDDAADARRHLTSAQAAIGKGGDAAEDCSWAARFPDADSIKQPVRDLKKLCQVEVPLARATRAVVKAEKAKAEQPEAPSFTECSSDEWAQAKATFDDMATPDQRFVALKARWAKVCP
jgi:hypothetical protein